jgi:hypothetical protein
MQGRVRWFPAQFTKALDKRFLDIVGEVVLCSEKHDTALGDYMAVSLLGGRRRLRHVLVIARSRIKSSEFSALMISFTRFTSMYSRPMTGVVSSYLKRSRAPDDDKGFGYCFAESSACSVMAGWIVVVVVDMFADDFQICLSCDISHW